MMHAWEGSPCPSSASHRPAAVRSARKRVAQFHDQNKSQISTKLTLHTNQEFMYPHSLYMARTYLYMTRIRPKPENRMVHQQWLGTVYGLGHIGGSLMIVQRAQSTGTQSKGETRHTSTPMSPRKVEEASAADPWSGTT
jgi:hypothetical protein